MTPPKPTKDSSAKKKAGKATKKPAAKAVESEKQLAKFEDAESTVGDDPMVVPPARMSRLSRLQALHRISIAMTSTMQPAELIKQVVGEVVHLTDADRTVLYMVDHQTQRLSPRFTFGSPVEERSLDLMDSDDLAVEVCHTGIARQALATSSADGVISRDFECRLAVPLMADDEVMAVLDMQARRCSPFDTETEELLTTLAAQAALVIRNALNHEELAQHYRELSLLYEIQQEITSAFDYHDVLTLLVARAKKLFQARECSIRLVMEQDGRRFVRMAATTGKHFIGPEMALQEESYVENFVMGGDMLYMEDVRTDERFANQARATEVGIVSLLAAPLVTKGKAIGAIRLYTGERREFSVADRKMLLALAGQAAVAIENTRLYKQIELKNRELSNSYDTLRRTQHELVKNERLAALGEMAATVAHEIRNPLTSIRGFAQRIARRPDAQADERMVHYTGIIIEEVDRLNEFIKDVLDFARHVKPAFEKVNLNKILGDIVDLIGEDLQGSEIMLVPALDMELRETVVDSSLIKQMLLNVVQNARQALGNKGVITLRTQNAGAYVRIRVADNGAGIPREELKKIWSPFYTTKTQGTGLGLALVQRIVDDHRGRITIRSRVGMGTIVDIFIPIVESEDALLQYVV